MNALTNLTKREIFSLCHSTAKKVTAKLGGQYSANFTCALRAIYADIRAAKAQPVVSVKPASNRVDFLASDALVNRSRYTPWEREFLISVAGRALSPKQQTVIDRLYAQHA